MTPPQTHESKIYTKIIYYTNLVGTQESLPILLIGYIREDLISQRLREVTELPKTRVYIYIDANIEGRHLAVVSKVENFIRENSNHQIKLILRDSNYGLTMNVTSAITEVLIFERSVLVVEDDITISLPFYESMVKGLALLEESSKIGIVGGFSPLRQSKVYKRNHWRETKNFSVWGWIATREVWKNYTYNLDGIDFKHELEKSDSWNSLGRFKKSVWLSRFEKSRRNPLNTWDIQMQYCSLVYDYENLLPLFRLTDNLGFNDSRAVHTKGKLPRWYKISKRESYLIANKILPHRVSRIMDWVDSLTFLGDSKVIYYWNSKIKSNQKSKV
jgi:hypothetical protein